mmetsp:Transcript_22135/g.56087  ORF Transcript_22135/g.56087 Transcript_22135/m.56087 type:complete len:279 (+) Transcript_22135:538-1374(+)
MRPRVGRRTRACISASWAPSLGTRSSSTRSKPIPFGRRPSICRCCSAHWMRRRRSCVPLRKILIGAPLKSGVLPQLTSTRMGRGLAPLLSHGRRLRGRLKPATMRWALYYYSSVDGAKRSSRNCSLSKWSLADRWKHKRVRSNAHCWTWKVRWRTGTSNSRLRIIRSLSWYPHVTMLYVNGTKRTLASNKKHSFASGPREGGSGRSNARSRRREKSNGKLQKFWWPRLTPLQCDRLCKRRRRGCVSSTRSWRDGSARETGRRPFTRPLLGMRGGEWRG